MDLLDDILATLDLKGVFYYRTDFSPPWGVTVPDLPQAARFHLMVQGVCHLHFPDGAALSLAPGDLVLIPRGRSHVLADAPGREAPLQRDLLRQAGYDGRGVFVLGAGDPQASTQMVCGHLSFRRSADHPLLRALPDYLLTRAATRMAAPWLDETLRLLVRRVFAAEIGSAAAVARLSEIVFIEQLRLGIAHSPALAAVLTALQDRRISAALELIHRQPARAWTVATLARAVGMSRSRFAERFRDLLGQAPMAYLSDWRLQKALALLEDTRMPVQQVAGAAGYQSPAAFTRAFTGRFGVTPSGHRETAVDFADRPFVLAETPKLTA